ncbi:MAG: NACHT domain-containing protein [Treponema sp.]|nr:NACHT domain-containing protein [Treponema sp.]
MLACDRGWVWAFYYSDSNGQKASHFALVHAEGKPLIKDLAEGIIDIDNNLNKLFKNLVLVNKEKILENQGLKSTREKYFKYLENELGEIQFEGLPTDKEAGSVKVKLENIFVPLHFSQNIQQDNEELFDIETKRDGIGEILNKKTKLAILAKPGGGKSTFIKRIAIAYAFPERRKQINDNLPDKNWFPIFLRCRELGDRVMQSITEIIHSIPVRAEIKAEIPSCVEYFSILVSDALQNGNALLLIDGLDEIAEDKNRVTFVNQLRTFIATYPTLNIIVTSREAGFRVVAGSLASYCENYIVSKLINSEIEELCIKWHKAIIDESENTVKDAKKLSALILKDSRIKALARNPLLLTTLLFVKRWAGYLPTKKNVLYQEMIKLLLVTWNVEGHEKLDIEETEPQLAFVAYWMTKNGQQTISVEELEYCLVEARKQMPAVLGYTNISPVEFIKQVESRSSLLIMSGHKRLDTGQLSAIYEFLHLSFQEYLTAKAIVKKYIPLSDISNEIVDIIKHRVNNENWKEVIPLVAVLLERDCKDLIEYLIHESKRIANKKQEELTGEDRLISSLLGSCLENEVQITPDLLGDAIEWNAKCYYAHIYISDNLDIILKSKFGNIYREKVRECFFKKHDDKYIASLGGVLGAIFLTDNKNNDNHFSILKQILIGLKEGNKEEKCINVLGFLEFIFESQKIDKKERIQFSKHEMIFNLMLTLLKTDDPHYHFSVCWCIAWAGDRDVFPDSLRMQYVILLAKIWTKSSVYEIKRVASWALSRILIPTITKQDVAEIEELSTRTQEYYNNPDNEFDKITAVYFGSILGKLFDENELEEIFNERTRKSSNFLQFAKELKLKTLDKDQ